MKFLKRLILISLAFFMMLAGGLYGVSLFLKSGFDDETAGSFSVDSPQTAVHDAPIQEAPIPGPDENEDEQHTTAMPKADGGSQQSSMVSISERTPAVGYDIATNATGKAPEHTGRRINIALIGVDSRLNDRTKHADANHIISIFPESGNVDITSIPRDTKADAGYPADSKLNILTIVRSKRGINGYLAEAAKIAECGKIDYYVEVGFSQAMGILELLGYNDPSSSLQVLRSRTALGNGDYQRSYSQGQFVRQMLLKNFNRLTGLSGSLLVRGGLMMVETNITADVANGIIEELEKANFGHNPNAVSVRLVPAFPAKFKVYDFTQQETFTSLKSKIEKYNKWRDPVETDFEKPIGKFNPLPMLKSALAYGERNVAKNAKHVVARLRTLYDQRAWLQVEDPVERQAIRQQFLEILPQAYEKIQKPAEAEKIRNTISAEIEIFSKAKM
ncbi:MAG TPA: hypothetical protein VEC36_01885 [Patescibacteria group bacterium]|nr:hypothetical protein [Patescibacteria group bacterium]